MHAEEESLIHQSARAEENKAAIIHDIKKRGGNGPIKFIWGERYGKLVVVGLLPDRDHGKCQWLCLCDCGNILSVSSGSLQAGATKSCGCLRREISRVNMYRNRRTITIHGHARRKNNKERTYLIWAHMKNRCFLKTDKQYKRYGGRGIGICKEWADDYMSFRDWAINNGYADGLTIDRIDNDGNYEPSNCRWITQSENSKKMWADRKRAR